MRLKVLLICSVLFDFIASGAEERLLSLSSYPDDSKKNILHNEKHTSCLGINPQFIQFINAPVINLQNFDTKRAQKRSLSDYETEDLDDEDENNEDEDDQEEEEDYNSPSSSKTPTTRRSKIVRHAPTPPTALKSEIKHEKTTTPVETDFFLGPVVFSEINLDHLSAWGKVVPFTVNTTTTSPLNPRNLLILPFRVQILPNPEFNETELQQKIGKKKTPSSFFKRLPLLLKREGLRDSQSIIKQKTENRLIDMNPFLKRNPVMLRPLFGYQQMSNVLQPKIEANYGPMNVPWGVESKGICKIPFPRSVNVKSQQMYPPKGICPEMAYMVKSVPNAKPNLPLQCNRRHWLVVSNNQNRALRSLPEFLRVWDKFKVDDEQNTAME